MTALISLLIVTFGALALYEATAMRRSEREWAEQREWDDFVRAMRAVRDE